MGPALSKRYRNVKLAGGNCNSWGHVGRLNSKARGEDGRFTAAKPGDGIGGETGPAGLCAGPWLGNDLIPKPTAAENNRW